MANWNKLQLMGNLTRDPELKLVKTRQGEEISKCEFTLAVNDNQGAVDYFPIIAWRKLASIIVEHKTKGDGMFVEAKLKPQNWETEDGSKRSKLAIVAQNVQFLPRANGSGASSANGGGQGEQQEAADGIPSDEELDAIPIY